MRPRWETVKDARRANWLKWVAKNGLCGMRQRKPYQERKLGGRANFNMEKGWRKARFQRQKPGVFAIFAQAKRPAPRGTRTAGRTRRVEDVKQTRKGGREGDAFAEPRAWRRLGEGNALPRNRHLTQALTSSHPALGASAGLGRGGADGGVAEGPRGRGGGDAELLGHALGAALRTAGNVGRGSDQGFKSVVARHTMVFVQRHGRGPLDRMEASETLHVFSAAAPELSTSPPSRQTGRANERGRTNRWLGN